MAASGTAGASGRTLGRRRSSIGMPDSGSTRTTRGAIRWRRRACRCRAAREPRSSPAASSSFRRRIDAQAAGTVALLLQPSCLTETTDWSSTRGRRGGTQPDSLTSRPSWSPDASRARASASARSARVAAEQVPAPGGDGGSTRNRTRGRRARHHRSCVRRGSTGPPPPPCLRRSRRTASRSCRPAPGRGPRRSRRGCRAPWPPGRPPRAESRAPWPPRARRSGRGR